MSHHLTAEARDMTAMTSLFLRNDCLPCSMYGSSTPARAQRLAPFSSARLAPSPDGPLTHFASPRGETCRLSMSLALSAHCHGCKPRAPSFQCILP
ncbi:MAG: hypothetical protein OXL36_15365 [Bryobacterales bacterium]|nr:hypothetical protein [Bryobacterales bacterium]